MKLLRRTITFVLTLVVFFAPTDAQNLVNNPSFEVGACPSSSSQINNAIPWRTARHSPEYMHTCGANQYCWLPTNYWGTEAAATGNACFGGLQYGSFASTYLVDLREYASSTLSSPLVPGQTYYVSFKANLADLSSHACSHLGVDFTTGYPTMWPLGNTAAVFTPNVITQTNGWVDITGSFVATTAHTHVVIGNFFQDANINVQSMRAPTIGWNAYYFIDDVCVSLNAVDCGTILPADWGQITATNISNRAVKVGWSTTAEKNTDHYIVERSLDGSVFEPVGQVQAAGDSDTETTYALRDFPGAYGRSVFYRVRLVDRNGSTHASPVAETMLEEEAGEVFDLSPNPAPANAPLRVFLTQSVNKDVTVEIVDELGRKVLVKEFESVPANQVLELDLADIEAGVYHVVVRADAVSASKSLVIVR